MRAAGRLRDWGVPLLLLGLAPLLPRQFSDPDIWFHLVIGREIFERGAIPATEFHVFPALGEAAHYPAAGYDLLQYLLHLLGGRPALVVFNALLSMATLYALHRALSVQHARVAPGWTALALAIAFCGLNPRFVYRPETLLYFAVALELWALERWLADPRWPRLMCLPLLAGVLANLHSTAIFVPLVFGAYLLHWLMHAHAAHRARGGPWLPAGLPAVLGAFLLTTGATLLNPYGLDQLTVLLAGLGSGGSALVEYLPVHRTEYLPHFILLVVAILAGALLGRGLRACDALVALGFGLLAFLSARNIALLALAAFMPLARGLHAFGERAAREARARMAAPVAFVVALAVFVAATLDEKTWGFGVDDEIVPVAGSRLLKSQLAAGNVFNFFHFGGYLAWELGRDFRVAIDGHFVRPSAAHELHNRFFRADPGWSSIAARFDVRAIVTPATLSYSGTLIPLVEVLARDPRWRLVSVEPAGLSFVAETLAGALPALDKRAVWEQVIREARRTLALYPGQPGAERAIERAQSELSGGVLR